MPFEIEHLFAEHVNNYKPDCRWPHNFHRDCPFVFWWNEIKYTKQRPIERAMTKIIFFLKYLSFMFFLLYFVILHFCPWNWTSMCDDSEMRLTDWIFEVWQPCMHAKLWWLRMSRAILIKSDKALSIFIRHLTLFCLIWTIICWSTKELYKRKATKSHVV